MSHERDRVTQGLKKLHIHKLYNLFFRPSNVTMIKSSRTGWVGYVARMGYENIYVSVGKS
jgi:hypothetical protein